MNVQLQRRAEQMKSNLAVQETELKAQRDAFERERAEFEAAHREELAQIERRGSLNNSNEYLRPQLTFFCPYFYFLSL